MDTTIEYPRRESRDWLSLPLTRLVQLNWVTVTVGILFLAGILTRFWHLEANALHHDESLHAVYSWYLYIGNGYRHDPLMHGPWLFHATAFVMWLFGDSDFTVRVSAVLFGLGVLLFPVLLRRWVGTAGMLAGIFLTLISPSFLYYSRFIREDIFCALWQCIIVWMMFRYLEDGRKFHLAGTATGLALFYSNKESSFLFSAVIWGFLLLLFIWRRRQGLERNWRSSRIWDLLAMIAAVLLPLTSAVWIDLLFGEALGWGWLALDYSTTGLLRSGSVVFAMIALALFFVMRFWDLRTFALAAAAFYLPYLLLHTTFLTNGYGIASGLVGALGYWIEQHGVRRGEQPWFYYLILVPLYDFLPLFAGVFGGGYYLLRRRNGDLALEDEQPRVVGIFPLFLVWWLVTIFVILSIAGEKMPWLILNMTLPAIWLAAWALGHFFDGIDWQGLRERNGLWFVLTFGAATFAFLVALWMLLNGQFPFRGTELDALNITARWVAALLILVGAGWAARQLARPLGQRAARQGAILLVLTFLSIMTIRYAWMATYTHGDIAREMLIYTQSTPDVQLVMDEITRLSERTEGGLNMKVAYDNEVSWPFEWYLRNFPNKIFYSNAPGPNISEAPVVLVGLANENAVRPYVQGYVRRQYKQRWWFPEDYKMFESQPNLIFEYLSDPAMRKDLLDILLYRRLKQPLGSTDFVMYVRPDVLREVWQFGSRVQAVDPNLLRDEYAEKLVDLAATESFGLAADVQLSAPKAVAATSEGNLVVADSGNHRIVVLSPNQELITSFGSLCNLADQSGCQGNGAGQFNEPWGVAVGPDDSIYVADTWNHRIQKFDAEGEFVTMWGTFADTGGALGEPSTFWGPRAIAVDQEGNVYVTDTGNKRIQKFDEDGTFIAQFGGVGADPGQFNEPVGLAVSPDGTIYVADTWNRRIQAFDPDFTPLRNWQVRGWSGESVVNKPYIAADDEHVWITDPESFRIVEFTDEGELSQVWGTFGSAENGLNLPFGLAVAPDGALFVADSANNRVQRFETE